MVPETIGRYRIQAELGRGGMSTVYLAHDPHFEREVAVKLLPVELSHHPTFRKRFEREAKVVAALADPAIVPVYDFGEEKGQPYLVMRFMPGGSLAERLHQGPLSLANAAFIIGRLAPALDEVHAHKVVHRDLKPSNILFDQRGEPYISDFGTVKMTKATTQLTDTGGAVGTPAYMSPEQIQGEAELDGRSDIYTLGIILYEMLSGKHPYQSNTPIAVAVKHMFEPTPRILDARPDLPPEIQTIVNKAMAKQPDDRYDTAVAFAQAICALTPDVELPAASVVVEPPHPQAGRRLALIISTSEHQDRTLASLTRPTANIHRLVDVLRDPQIGRFDQVSTLVDESADAIRRAVAHFFADGAKEDLLLLYFMGHAAVGAEEKLYLAAQDTEHNLLRATAIPASYLAEVMDDSQAWQQVLVLDCTFSNASSRDSRELIGRVATTDDAFNRNGHERVILSAADRVHYEWRRDGVTGSAMPSLFTHFFIEGLKTGAADHDRNGRVTIDEVFAYVHEQLQRKTSQNGTRPYKWASFAYQEASHIVIGHNPQTPPPTPILPLLSPSPTAAQPHHAPVHQRKPVLLLALLLAVLFIIGSGWVWQQVISPPTASAALVVVAPSATPTETATTPPTATHKPTQTATGTSAAPSTSTPTHTALATAVPTQPATPTPTITDYLAVAHLASSLFTEPDTAAPEITFIGIGETVAVMGRSENGEWLFVENAEGIQGYVHAPRLDWAGQIDALPVMDTAVNIIPNPSSNPISNPTPTTPATCRPGNCPLLSLDTYPINPPRCENNTYYRTVFMMGHGGDGRYTYYWNEQKMAGPLLNEGFGFEVNSPDKSPVIGIAKIVSGDGQSIEKELFVSDFGCQ
ncbi:MAG TPA: protein kinase [Chloroflexota bacterium]|nr:protein kinase [Chloroflexota bacterium]HUM69494.1 protein kinase [Chloroflexota bacterium]